MHRDDIDKLVDALAWISLNKRMLPFGLRRWTTILGLYVQERSAGPLTRLQAGGKFRRYIDIWKEREGTWEVRTFDEETWNRRFAHLVEPTYQISDYVLDHCDSFDGAEIAALREVAAHFEATGEWRKP